MNHTSRRISYIFLCSFPFLGVVASSARVRFESRESISPLDASCLPQSRSPRGVLGARAITSRAAGARSLAAAGILLGAANGDQFAFVGWAGGAISGDQDRELHAFSRPSCRFDNRSQRLCRTEGRAPRCRRAFYRPLASPQASLPARRIFLHEHHRCKLHGGARRHRGFFLDFSQQPVQRAGVRRMRADLHRDSVIRSLPRRSPLARDAALLAPT